jgi:hypothetical protein
MVICLVVLFTTNVGAQSYTVTIGVQGILSSMTTDVYVDGAANGTLSGGQTRDFIFTTASGSHVITVDFYVPNSVGLNGTRFYDKDTSWTFNSAGNHIFTYSAQYYLKVQTSYSTPVGEGWYDSGTSAQAAIKDGQVTEGQGIRYAFTGWSGDASGTSLTSNIVMTSPKSAIAVWKTQFYLTVEADPPSVNGLSGSGWYDAGTRANFSAPNVVPVDQDSRLRFTQWTGSFNGASQSGNVAMDRPQSVKAHYIAQYLLSIQYDPASIPTSYNETHGGWYDANANVQLGPAPLTIQSSDIERLKFKGWNNDGTPLSDVSVTVYMDKAHKVVLSYNTQFYVEVHSTYGIVSGSGWYDKGSSAKISAPTSSGSWPITYTLSGWIVDPSSGRLEKTDDSWSLTVDRPYVVEAVWNVDYFPIIALLGGGGVALALLTLGIVMAYRRGVFRREQVGQVLEQPRPKAKRPPRVPAGSIRICNTCGYRTTDTAAFCQKCGAPFGGSTRSVSSTEDKVYDYIVKNEGVISLSKASKELGISVDELNKATANLKKKGRLA